LKKKILYIEDEQFLGKIVKDTLEKQGYNVWWEADGAKVMAVFERFSPDICVVDIMLPNIDGYTLSTNIRGLFPGLPIIFLTAKTEIKDLIKGFKSGGTDYMRKPFSIEELIARIENQLTLHNGKQQVPDVAKKIRLGMFDYYPSLYELAGPDGHVNLSHREGQVLNILCANRNHVTDRKNLLLSVWGDDSFFNSRTLDVYIRKLRQYFKGDSSIQITTLKAKGYLFIVP
jgi:DNA-binding response OmpR family regulator